MFLTEEPLGRTELHGKSNHCQKFHSDFLESPFLLLMSSDKLAGSPCLLSEIVNQDPQRSENRFG